MSVRAIAIYPANYCDLVDMAAQGGDNQLTIYIERSAAKMT
jgi:hypothetical protein